MGTDLPQTGDEKSDANPPRFRLLPNWRMQPEFPWQIWAVGWLAVIKALLWMSTDPVVPGPLAGILAAKFLIAMVPFLLLGIGVWNLRRWAVWGLLAAAVGDITFFLIFSDAWRFISGGSFWGLAAVLLICNGPIGNILILLATPVLLKNAGRFERLRALPE
jgi:hypothetical protein